MQNTVNPAGLVGGPPTPKGQEFTYAITAQGRLRSESDFEDIIIRENSDGFGGCAPEGRGEGGTRRARPSTNIVGRLNGRPTAVMALYQWCPIPNALTTLPNA